MIHLAKSSKLIVEFQTTVAMKKVLISKNFSGEVGLSELQNSQKFYPRGHQSLRSLDDPDLPVFACANHPNLCTCDLKIFPEDLGSCTCDPGLEACAYEISLYRKA